jgi:ketosteroid isomerase-like protein
MKLMLAVSVLFLVCSAQAQTGSKTAAVNDSELKNAEQQWVEAYYNGDGKTLARFETDDFTVIANGQKETKE